MVAPAIAFLQIDLGTALACDYTNGPASCHHARLTLVFKVVGVGRHARETAAIPSSGPYMIDLSRVGLPARLKHINQRRKRN